MSEENDDAPQWKTYFNGLFEKRIVSPGQGTCHFSDGTKCTVVLKPSMANAHYFEDQIEVPFDEEAVLILGESQTALLDVIDMCLRSMHQGEVCIMRAPVPNDSKMKCNDAMASPDIFELEISLMACQAAKGVWEMAAHEKLCLAKRLKDLGVAIYQKQDVNMSFKKFSRALKYLISINLKTEDLAADICKECNLLKMQCYLNLAACQLQSGNFAAVVPNCTKALDIDKDNLKGLFRRGEAYLKLEDWEKAASDLNRAHELEPKNKAVLQSLKNLHHTAKIKDEQMARSIGKMFA